jgi:transcriptional regulator with XRE-family HTH domain
MDVRRRLARNLLRMRHERGFSQEELAEESDIHRTYMSDLERAQRNPTILVLERLAKALKTTESKLLE